MTQESAEELKLKGNELYKEKRFEKAIEVYQEALMCCDEEDTKLQAVLWSNISACHWGTQDYKQTVEACTKSIDLDGTYIKPLLRRSHANEKLDTWASLETAMEDLTKLKEITADNDTKLNHEIEARIRQLAPKLKAKQEAETSEAIGKLKDLGNGILQNFGLSLDNFKMTQNSDGGYSMNFKQ